MTVSPRKMCVPGVHAYASDGVAAIATSAMHATQIRKVGGCLPDSRAANLDPDPLTLPSHRFAEIVHFRANHVVDRFTSAVDVFTNRVGNVLYRDRLDEIFAAITSSAIPACCLLSSPARTIASAVCSPSRTRCRTITSPSRTLESRERGPFGSASSSTNDRRNRTPSARPGAEDQCDDSSYSSPQKGGRQQVELLLTLFVRIRLADGRAGAASPTRCRLQCICHPGPPPFQMPR